MCRCGTTIGLELEEYQPEPSPVCVAWTEVESPVEEGEERVLLTVVERGLEELLEEVEEVVGQTITSLLSSHRDGWEEVWEGGRVEVEGNEHLARTLLAAQYYLYLSLAFPDLSSRPLPPYCGLSPGGLAHGLLEQDYQVPVPALVVCTGPQLLGHILLDAPRHPAPPAPAGALPPTLQVRCY